LTKRLQTQPHVLHEFPMQPTCLPKNERMHMALAYSYTLTCYRSWGTLRCHGHEHCRP